MTFSKKSLILLLIALPFIQLANAADIWFEDSNLGTSHGMPADFVEKFDRPESFAKATRYIDVYLIRPNYLYQLDDYVLTSKLLPYLKRNKIKLAINAGGANWTQKGAGRKKVFDSEIELFERLKRLGFKVDYISLQSVLSKAPKKGGDKAEYPLEMRMEDIVNYARAVRSIYPDVQVGIIDALPSHSKDYRHPYLMLKNTLAHEKITLSYIHLDMPFDVPKSQKRGITWQTVREVESFVENELGIRFGLIATTIRGGNTSSKAFHEGVLGSLQCYTGVQGTPGDFIIASWYAYPQQTVPEFATGDDYPSMRTVLEFGKKLDQIEKINGSTSRQVARQFNWRSNCTPG